MIRRRTVSLLVLFAGAALLSGCLTANRADSSLSPVACTLPAEKSADQCLAMAREMDARGLEKEAIQQYEAASQLAPQRTEWVAWRLAVLYDHQGDAARSLKEYDRALQFAPDNADLLNDLGAFHFRRGDVEEADRWFRKAVAANNGPPQGTLNLAQAGSH